MLLLPFTAGAAEMLLDVRPLVCVGKADEPCPLNAKVSWHADRQLCLVLARDPGHPFTCQQQTSDFPLKLSLNGNIRLQLLDAVSLEPVAEREIRYLQSSSQSSALIHRRLEWSLFR
ncbi:DUF3019 domain-containing protein [Gallaecimonas kandeliae]|uniref:DUF3019 domain-containing protein n=1 Tax=Gallaecimonas kandeliae TaxID=3029055 RepID=UPI0026494433|nr:DUF3019 domain-containing protein [Gallaecimonas kandeliae]WKE65849.1 DUF3019 domain-containing protein [Gallaecimonas kandeliae]